MNIEINPLGILLIVVAAVMMIILTTKTDMLKDESNCVVGKKPFSLAKVQLALWSFIIFSSFVLLLGAEGFALPNEFKFYSSTLLLLGISGGTTVLGNTIDASDIQNSAVVRRHQDDCSQGFWLDILSGSQGVSIHRYQHVVFSMVLMISYLVFVLGKEELPDWDESVLMVSGISSATYLGVKINENRS